MSFRFKLLVIAMMTALLTTLCLSTPRAARAAGVSPTPAGTTGVGLSTTARADVLGPNWQTSTDQVWGLTSSADGVGVLTARVSDGVSWTQVNSLSVSGVDSRQWIGQGCLLAGSRELAVAFGPIEYLDIASAYERGAYAALVDLDTGAITRLPIRPTFSYFSPTCGADGTATFTSFGTDESTTSMNVVTKTGAVVSSASNLAGEFTDATRIASGQVVAVHGSGLVSISGGTTTALTRTPAAPYGLHATSDGGLAYLIDSGSGTTAHRYLKGDDTVVASGSRGDLSIDAVAGGRLVVHGRSARAGSTKPAISVAQAAHDSTASLGGTAFVALAGLPAVSNGVSATISSVSGTSATETIPPAVFAARTSSSTFATATTSTVTSSATTDANLPCAIQRNDVKTEAYQPSVAQVEWAVDQAVAGRLTTTRPANYRGFGLPSYAAQSLFPLTALKGGGSVPPQILLGILANESNLWQASSHVSAGGYGNSLTGNIYGRDYSAANTLTIDFSAADCGYGIAQVTDGMRTGQMSATSQRAVALDYQTNIAAGADILISKWNQLASYSPPITMNDGTPQWIENWYAAAWAYNSGLQPNSDNGNTTGCTPGPTCTDSAGNWGLGWANNPANPIYQPNRHMFNSDPSDASHPSQWPYQERVIGWAAYPIYESGGSYAQAWWVSDAARTAAIPSPSLFCTTANHCGPGGCQYPIPYTDPLAYHCWTHTAISWSTCSSGNCGHSSSTYAAGSAEPKDPTTQDPADCNQTSLPANAIVVDDIPSATPSPYASCHSVTTTGSFAFTFTADANGNYPAHIDLHQINGGLNGHYWFTHTTPNNDNTAAVGTWSFPSTTSGWGRLMVHVPALGAQTPQAAYTIIDGTTKAVQRRILDQGWGSNQWLSLGSVQFSSGEKVSMTSFAPNDTGNDIAWDAVAFVPAAKPTYKVVALGDSYSSGEGVYPYRPNTDNSIDGCHRSPQAYSALLKLPNQTVALGANSADEYDFLACSGAHSTSMTANAVNTSTSQENPFDAQWGAPYYDHDEELQIPTGYLDANTDAVTLSIGGNDARFADVITTCLTSGLRLNDCSASSYIMSGDKTPLPALETHIIQDLLPAKLQATYLAVHQAAPNAVIFVVGYPRLFPTAGSTESCPIDLTLTLADEQWINSLSALMTKTIQNAVTAVAAQGVKIHFVDPTASFSSHDICASSNWLNGVVLTPSTSGSFHPTTGGQAGYAALVTAAMAQWLPAK
jgi:hypothetical protein